MKREIYIAPVLSVVRTEPQAVIAMSIDTSKVEWEDDVDLEVKEQSNFDNIWDTEW
ncbi:MAG: hypothetical protein J6W03_08545 [Bacteroidaceae bacterium]|nr:hypothetical protein [Bacteroidaceae bacterium]